MAKGIFVFDVIATFILSASLLWNYGNWMKHRILVTLAVLVAWYFSFMIVFVIPLDVSSTAFRQCKNASTEKWKHNATLQHRAEIELNHKLGNQTTFTEPPMTGGILQVTGQDINKTRRNLSGSLNTIPNKDQPHHPTDKPINDADWSFNLELGVDADTIAYNECEPPYSILNDNVLPSLWRVVYWSSQFLTWLILPLMQSYSQAGEFTRTGKLKSSLWDNAIFYSSYLLIALILLIYVAVQPSLHLNWDRTKAIAAAASNTWGLFVLVLLLGYGLVEVPRDLWNRSQRGYQLKHAHFKVCYFINYC